MHGGRRVRNKRVCTSPAGPVSAGVHVEVSVAPVLKTLPSFFASLRSHPVF